MRTQSVVLAFVVMAALPACQPSPARPCDTDADCEVDGRCDDRRGVCFGPDETVDAGPSCAPVCDGLSECRDGRCLSRYQALELSAPAGTVRSAQAVGRARLVLAPGFASNPPTLLPYTVRAVDGGVVQTGALALSGPDTFEAPLPGLLHGTYSLSASTPDGGLSAISGFRIDELAAVFSLSVPLRDAGASTATTVFEDPSTAYRNAWLRSDAVTVEVTSPSTDVDSASVQVTLFGTDGGSASFPVVARTGCPGYCGSCQVKLHAVEMNAFRAELPLTVEGRDLAGNASSAAGGVRTTRWRWAFAASPGQIRGGPAIGQFGDLYFGTDDVNGNVYAVSASGAERWRTPAGRITGSLALSGRTDAGIEHVFAAAETASGAVLLALHSVDGGSLATCGPYANETARNAVAVVATSAGGVAFDTGIAVLGGSGFGRMVGVRPSAPPADLCANISGSFPSPVDTSGLVASFGNIYYAANDLSLTSYTAVSSNSPRTGFPKSLGMNGYALAISGAELAGGGGLAATQGGLFAAQLSGAGGVEFRFPPGGPPSSRIYGLVLDGAGMAIVGNETSAGRGNLSRVRLTDGGLQATAPDAGVFRGAMALGAAGEVVAAGSTGIDGMGVFDSATLSRRWGVSGVIPPAEASVSLDCPRDVSGRVLPERPGVAYVAATDGKLYSFVVDSRGIDPSALWPKWQHDPRNTGNADVPLAQFSCGP